MRRVNCPRCAAVVVEEVPWAYGKRQLTKVYMLFLSRWARRLSWKETAAAFRTSWDKVFDAVEHVVNYGLEHRTLGPIDAIGVDEIQYSKGHKYLTLVYQIDVGMTRLLWVGKERTVASFQEFFTLIGEEVASKIVFVCSDMWQPYLRVIREKCSQALHILDRFHIVAKMNLALDEVRSQEAGRMRREGFDPVLKKSRWLLLKLLQNLSDQHLFRLGDSGVVEGLNNKAKLTIRKSYGFRTCRSLQLALYHSLAKLPKLNPPTNSSDESYFLYAKPAQTATDRRRSYFETFAAEPDQLSSTGWPRYERHLGPSGRDAGGCPTAVVPLYPARRDSMGRRKKTTSTLGKERVNMAFRRTSQSSRHWLPVRISVIVWTA